jgi:hypothetical protein
VEKYERLVCEALEELNGAGGLCWSPKPNGKLTLDRAGLESLADRSPHLLFQRADRVDIRETRQFPPRLFGMFALEFA